MTALLRPLLVLAILTSTLPLLAPTPADAVVSKWERNRRPTGRWGSTPRSPAAHQQQSGGEDGHPSGDQAGRGNRSP